MVVSTYLVVAKVGRAVACVLLNCSGWLPGYCCAVSKEFCVCLLTLLYVARVIWEVSNMLLCGCQVLRVVACAGLLKVFWVIAKVFGIVDGWLQWYSGWLSECCYVVAKAFHLCGVLWVARWFVLCFAKKKNNVVCASNTNVCLVKQH